LGLLLFKLFCYLNFNQCFLCLTGKEELGEKDGIISERNNSKWDGSTFEKVGGKKKAEEEYEEDVGEIHEKYFLKKLCKELEWEEFAADGNIPPA
jgi:hypothetical protein